MAAVAAAPTPVTPHQMDEMNSTTLQVIDDAYGPNSDLYRDVLGVHSNATPEQMQHAYFHRRNELFQLLSSLEQEDEQDSITESHRFHAERKLDAVVTAMRILGDPEMRIQYDDMRQERIRGAYMTMVDNGNNISINRQVATNSSPARAFVTNNSNSARPVTNSSPGRSRSTKKHHSRRHKVHIDVLDDEDDDDDDDEDPLVPSSRMMSKQKSMPRSSSSRRESRRKAGRSSPASFSNQEQQQQRQPLEVDANGFPRYLPKTPAPARQGALLPQVYAQPPLVTSIRGGGGGGFAAGFPGPPPPSNRAPSRKERREKSKKRERGLPMVHNGVTTTTTKASSKRSPPPSPSPTNNYHVRVAEVAHSQHAFPAIVTPEKTPDPPMTPPRITIAPKPDPVGILRNKQQPSPKSGLSQSPTTSDTMSATTSETSTISQPQYHPSSSNNQSPATSPSRQQQQLKQQSPSPQSPNRQQQQLRAQQEKINQQKQLINMNLIDGTDTILDSLDNDGTITTNNDQDSATLSTCSNGGGDDDDNNDRTVDEEEENQENDNTTFVGTEDGDLEEQATILSEDWSEGGDTLTVSQGNEGVLARIKDEFWGAIDDTTTSVQQVLNAFTLQEEDILAVTGQIRKAQKQIAKAF